MNTTQSKIALLESRMQKPVAEVLEKLKYPQPVKDLFLLSETEWQALYPEEAAKLQSHLKQHETRSITDLGKETCLAWILEDLTALYTLRKGRIVKRNGSDASRKFTYLSETRAKPDLLVSADGGKTFRKVEVTANFTDFFIQTGYQSFRFQKLQNMKADKAILLTLDVYSNRLYTAEAADLFSSSATGGKYWKREERVSFDHAILRREGDDIQILPVKWRAIPEGFWKV